jgi:carboxyvinyl-carboxyphosphonate phosphorylmutase
MTMKTTTATSRNKRLRELFDAPQILVAPSAYDCLSARVIQAMGFGAVHLTGAGSHASVLGIVDLGFMGRAEMILHAKNVAMAVDVPVISDADEGYGNALSFMRTVQEFEQAGVSGIHIEDQPAPKRCGHFDGKKIISQDEMCGKIAAGCAARRDPDFMIIARTDAVATHGVDEAIKRGNAYAEAGADCIFVDAIRTMEQMERVNKEIRAPLMVNMAEGGKTPRRTVRELESVGYKCVIYPLSGWMCAASSFAALLTELKETGSTAGFWDKKNLHMSFQELFELVGYSQAVEHERRYVKT